MKNYVIALMSVLILLACGGRNPGMSQKQLKDLINNPANVNKTPQKPVQLADSLLIKKNIPAGVKYTENRAIDPNNPPATIDIENAKTSLENYSVSDMGASIKRIKLSAPTDTMVLFGANRQSIHFYKNEFIVDGMKGIYVFDSKGMLRDTIYYDTKFEVSVVSKKNNKPVYSFRISDMRGGKRSCIIGNKLVYIAPSDKYEDDKLYKLTTYNLDTKIKEQIIPVGVADAKNIKGLFAIDNSSFAIQYNTVLTNEDMLRTFSLQGDTLCEFTNNEKVINFYKDVYANPEGDWAYYYNKGFTFRHGNNDTVFRMTSTNRLTPAYIINLGKARSDINNAVRANYFIGQKTLRQCVETSKHIYMRYSEIVSFPVNASNEPPVRNVIFDKKTGKTTQVASSLLWPDFYTKNGETAIVLTKQTIENAIKTNKRGAETNLQNNNKDTELLTEINNNLKNNEVMIVLIK